MGPAGELRYPSYRFNAYPGVGEFQCYDPYMLSNLKQAAAAIGHPEWGNGGPNNAGRYQDQPSQTGFWSENTFDNYASPYGQFFLGWYSNMLIAHGSRWVLFFFFLERREYRVNLRTYLWQSAQCCSTCIP